MDANTYTEFRITFETKAANLDNDSLTFGLADIRLALSMAHEFDGYRDGVSGLTDYEQKLFLERDAFIQEQQARKAARFNAINGRKVI